MQSILRLLFAFGILYNTAVAARDTVKPLPFHELGTYNHDVPVPWARPLAGETIQAVAVAPYSALGDLARLRAHMELDLETAAIWDSGHLGYDPRFPEPAYPDATYEAVEKRLAQLLGRKRIDIIILGHCDLNVFPETVQQSIVDRVRGGAGLLLTGADDYSQGEGPLTAWLRETPLMDDPPDIAHGVGPLGFNSMEGNALVSCRTSGEGRIVCINVEQVPSTNHCLVPVPDNPFALVPEHEADAFSLACKAVLWAAGREPEDRVNRIVDAAPTGPNDEEIPPGFPEEFVESVRRNAFSGPLRPFMLYLDAPATSDCEVVYQIRIPGAGLPPALVQERRAVLPKGADRYPLDVKISPGSYLLDVWLKNRKGIVTWHTQPVTVAGWPIIESLRITQEGEDAVWLHPNDHLDVRVRLAPGEFLTSRQEATVYARAVDSLGRQVARARQPVGPEGGTVVLRLELADLIAPLIKVEVFAYPSAHVTESLLVNEAARDTFYFPVRLPDPPLVPALVVSAARPFDYESLRQLEIFRLQFGASALHAPLGSDSLLAAGRSGLSRIAQVGTLDAGRVGADNTRIPCLSSPGYQEREAETIQAGVLESWAGGPPFYSLGTGFALTNTEANVCQSPDCLFSFQEYLQRHYDTLEALNQTWGAAFAQWGDVRPQALDQCQQTGRWAPWLDFRLAMNEVLARAPQQGRQAVHSVDGAGRVGFQSPAASISPLAGYDWRQLCAAVDFVTVPATGSALRRVRSYHRGHPYSGILLDPGQLDTDPTWAEWIAWDGLLRQIPALWLNNPIGNGPHNLVTPLDEPKPGLKALGESLRAIQEGVGTLILNASPQETGIAFADSPPSTYLDFANPDPSRTADAAESWLEDALNQMGFSAGVRSLTDPLAGINTLLLSRTHVLSDPEVIALREFHNRDGLILADGQPGLYDLHGSPRGAPALPFLHPLDPDHPEDAFSLWTNRPVWISQMEGAAGNKDILARLLRRAGNEPALSIQLPERQTGTVARFQFHFGAATIVACLASPDAGTTTRRGKLDLPDKHYGVDLLQPLATTPRGRLQWSITPGQATVFSILPYRVKKLLVHGPEIAITGQRLALDVVIETGGTPPGTHMVLLRLTDPSGQELRHYRRCIPVEGGALSTYVPLAENETPGFYTLSVRDILSREEVALRVEIQDPGAQ